MKNLLVAVDFSDVTERVVATAEQMARAFGAKVWLLHVVAEVSPMAALGEVPFHWPAVEAESPDRFPEEQRRMNELLAGLKGKEFNAESLLIRGSAIIEILAMAEQYEIDMIVMGSHGHGAWYELVVGTVSEGVLRHASCPAIIVPSAKPQKKKTERHWVEPMATGY